MVLACELKVPQVSVFLKSRMPGVRISKPRVLRRNGGLLAAKQGYNNYILLRMVACHDGVIQSSVFSF